MFDVGVLFDLQKVYNEETNLKKKLKDSLNSKIELTKQFEMTEKEFENAKSQLHNLKSKLNDENLKLASEETSVKKYTQELYTTHQSNPKYLRDIELKIQDLNKQKGSEEEAILMLMEEIDALQAKFAVLEKQHAEISEALALKKSMHDSLEKLTHDELNEIAKHKEQLRNQMDEDILETFDKLMLQCQGKAIASLVDGTCNICRFQIPLHERDVIKKNRDEIHFCSNCKRILIAY